MGCSWPSGPSIGLRSVPQGTKIPSIECGLRGREKIKAVAGGDIAGMTVSGIAGLWKKGMSKRMKMPLQFDWANAPERWRTLGPEIAEELQRVAAGELPAPYASGDWPRRVAKAPPERTLGMGTK